MISDDVGVSIPRELVVHAAAVDLDEADAALDESAGGEALEGHVLAVGLVEPVELADVLGLFVHVKSLGGGGLHAVGELEAVDAGGQFALGGGACHLLAVEGGEKVELFALALVRLVGGALHVGDGLALRLEPRALIDAGQESRRPVAGISFGEPAVFRVGHDHEAREVFAFGAEPVCDPRADARMPHARRAGVHHEERGRVIVRLGEARVDEGHFVHLRAQFGEEAAAPRACLSVLIKRERGLHEPADSVGEKARLRVKARHGLAVALFELGLVIPRVHMARAAVHKQPDDRFRLRGKMARLCGEGIHRRGGKARPREQRLKRDPAEAGSRALKHLAS